QTLHDAVSSLWLVPSAAIPSIPSLCAQRNSEPNMPSHLPFEIICELAKCASPATLKNLACASRQCHNTFIKQLYHHVILIDVAMIDSLDTTLLSHPDRVAWNYRLEHHAVWDNSFDTSHIVDFTKLWCPRTELHFVLLGHGGDGCAVEDPHEPVLVATRPLASSFTGSWTSDLDYLQVEQVERACSANPPSSKQGIFLKIPTKIAEGPPLCATRAPPFNDKRRMYGNDIATGPRVGFDGEEINDDLLQKAAGRDGRASLRMDLDRNRQATPMDIVRQSDSADELDDNLNAGEDEEGDAEGDEEDDENEEVIRCICHYNDDDGNTIACDKCGVWQHMLCVGIDPNDVPEKYYCEKCKPRPLDAEKAVELQRRQRERTRTSSRGPSQRERERGAGTPQGGGSSSRPSRLQRSRASNVPDKERETLPRRREAKTARGRGRPKARTEGTNAQINDAPERSPEVSRKDKEQPRGSARRQRVPFSQQHQLIYTQRQHNSNLSPSHGRSMPARHASNPLDDEYRHSLHTFAELSYTRFAEPRVATLVEKLCTEWDQSDALKKIAEHFASSKENAADMADVLKPPNTELTPIRAQWLENRIPVAVCDPIPVDGYDDNIDPRVLPGSLIDYGLFATADIPEGAFITDIKGSLTFLSKLGKSGGLPVIEAKGGEVYPAFVFPHIFRPSSHAERLVVDARGAGERGGRNVRRHCGAGKDEDEVCNAELRSIITYQIVDPVPPEPAEPTETPRPTTRKSTIKAAPLNARLLLAIYATRDISATEEIVLGPALGSESDLKVAGYPCVCSNPRICRTAKARVLYERMVRGEESDEPVEEDGQRCRSARHRRNNSSRGEPMSEDEADAPKAKASEAAPTRTNSKPAASGDSSKPLSREEKKLQDQLARIERMEKEAEKKKQRQGRRRTTSGGGEADGDDFDDARETEGTPRRRRTRQGSTEGTPGSEPDRPSRSGASSLQPSVAGEETAEQIAKGRKREISEVEARAESPPRRKRGLKAWIFAQEEAKKAQEAALVIPTVEDLPTDEASKAARARRKRTLSDAETGTAGEPDDVISGGPSTPTLKKVKLEDSVAPIKEAVPDDRKPLAATCDSTPATPAFVPPPVIRKVSLAEFMAKKRLKMEAAAAVSATASTLTSAVTTPLSSAPDTPLITAAVLDPFNPASESPFPTTGVSSASVLGNVNENKSSSFVSSLPRVDEIPEQRATVSVSVVSVTSVARAEERRRSVSVGPLHGTQEGPTEGRKEGPNSADQGSKGSNHFPIQAVTGLASIYGTTTQPPQDEPNSPHARRNGGRALFPPGEQAHGTLTGPSAGARRLSRGAGQEPEHDWHSRRSSIISNSGHPTFPRRPQVSPTIPHGSFRGPAPGRSPSRVSPPPASKYKQTASAYPNYRPPPPSSPNMSRPEPGFNPYGPGGAPAFPQQLYGPERIERPPPHFRRPPPRYPHGPPLPMHAGAGPRDYYDQRHGPPHAPGPHEGEFDYANERMRDPRDPYLAPAPRGDPRDRDPELREREWDREGARELEAGRHGGGPPMWAPSGRGRRRSWGQRDPRGFPAPPGPGPGGEWDQPCEPLERSDWVDSRERDPREQNLRERERLDRERFGHPGDGYGGPGPHLMAGDGNRERGNSPVHMRRASITSATVGGTTPRSAQEPPRGFQDRPTVQVSARPRSLSPNRGAHLDRMDIDEPVSLRQNSPLPTSDRRDGQRDDKDARLRRADIMDPGRREYLETDDRRSRPASPASRISARSRSRSRSVSRSRSRSISRSPTPPPRRLRVVSLEDTRGSIGSGRGLEGEQDRDSMPSYNGSRSGSRSPSTSSRTGTNSGSLSSELEYRGEAPGNPADGPMSALSPRYGARPYPRRRRGRRRSRTPLRGIGMDGGRDFVRRVVSLDRDDEDIPDGGPRKEDDDLYPPRRTDPDGGFHPRPGYRPELHPERSYRPSYGASGPSSASVSVTGDPMELTDRDRDRDRDEERDRDRRPSSAQTIRPALRDRLQQRSRVSSTSPPPTLSSFLGRDRVSGWDVRGPVGPEVVGGPLRPAREYETGGRPTRGGRGGGPRGRGRRGLGHHHVEGGPGGGGERMSSQEFWERTGRSYRPDYSK
ncbi:uncharacterized protein EV422DRAFT_593847, partial [Fimicolochytrium jonesii]|uniref:uncharacterized protein n=1 Tax=Fimicolochytrium jonesii TaxID=1396493 RepID=UPI0022FF0A4C